jgi:HK97 family phage major capsid protein
MEPKDIKAAVLEGLNEPLNALEAKLVAQIDEKVGAQSKAVGELASKVGDMTKRVEAVDKEAVRFDGKGRRFMFGGEAVGKAPGVVREGGLGDSKPLMVSNILRGVMVGAGHNDAAVARMAPEEVAMSDRLRKLGFQTDFLGSILYPLGPELFMDPVNEKGEIIGDFSALRKELRERLDIRAGIDPGEIAWLARKHSSIAKAMGLTSKDLAVGNDTLGGFLIPDSQAMTIIDLLRPRLTVMRAGATEIALPPTGNIAYPRLISDPSFAYADPDTTTDASTSNIGTGVIRMQAKSLRGFVTIPNDLLRYSSPSVELVVLQALANRIAVAEDNQFLEGIGSSLAPKGLLNYGLSTAETPTVNKLTLHVAGTVGANGDTFTPEDVMKIIGLYFMGNDPDMPTGWIMRPLMWAAIANRRADAISAADGKGPFMFWTSRGSAGAAVPEVLGGYPVFSSVNASNNRVKGSGTNLVYILFGNFARLVIGRVGALELAVSEHVKFLQDKIIIRAVERHDTGVQHEESFVLTDTMLES